MVPKKAKSKTSSPFSFSSIFCFMAILFLTINYIREQLSINKFQILPPNYSSQVVGRSAPWLDIIAQEIIANGTIQIGLINMDAEIDENEGLLHPRARMVKIHVDRVGQEIRWDHLYPEWIDENSSKCPDIPVPRVEDYKDLDVVVAKVPCGRRDVFRLQVNLVAANLLVRSSNNGLKDVYAVFIGSCGPMWEIFKCDDLIWHQGKYRIYKPQLLSLKQKLLMPVGTCQIASPLTQPAAGGQLWQTQSINNLPSAREAYVTVLHSSEDYVCGAIALAQSIIQSNSTKDLILLADHSISAKSLQGLREAGWRIKHIERIRSPYSRKKSYNEWNYSKLRIWQLEEYNKVIFIDSDLIVLRNMDEFFTYPEVSAVGNDKHLFNSGLMIIEPSKCTFQTLKKSRLRIASYNGGDQGFLNEMFSWWHRLPAKLNHLKFFGSFDELLHEIPKDVYALHYLGLKPWVCYKDYDCNWDRLKYRRFASDSAHSKWWHIYDTMPEKLQRFCSLTPKMDGRIKKYREKAKENSASFLDGHWKIDVKDSRRHSS